MAELVGFCVPIHACRCLPDPKCLSLSGLSLCVSVDHFCLVSVDGHSSSPTGRCVSETSDVKKSHSNQYLNFSSHHPLNHKLAVIRTLLERCYCIATEEDDRKEEQNVPKVLNK